MMNPTYKKRFIALVGPPGVGKTAIALAISEAMELPFNQISFGGVKDATSLIGHSSTYIGSRPGIFVNILKKAQSLNSVVLFDEIDKIPNTPEGQSISSVLLHALDKTQNYRFHDMYMPEIPIDLSHIFFILAMNDDRLIDPILKDRISIIKISGYTLNQKIEIANNYILPKVLTNLKFNSKDIMFPDETMEYLIKLKCSNEKGVRDLEKILTHICEKINILKYVNGSGSKLNLSYYLDTISFPVVITNKLIDKFVADF